MIGRRVRPCHRKVVDPKFAIRLHHPRIPLRVSLEQQRSLPRHYGVGGRLRDQPTRRAERGLGTSVEVILQR
jgi:hypothetical protein